jgi:hypothetical protein
MSPMCCYNTDLPLNRHEHGAHAVLLDSHCFRGRTASSGPPRAWVHMRRRKAKAWNVCKAGGLRGALFGLRSRPRRVHHAESVET